MALEIPETNFYANDASHYRDWPHEYLYQCLGWMWRQEESKIHFDKCLKFKPFCPKTLYNTRYYYEYFDMGIRGNLRFPEITFLYNEAKKYQDILEVGSWCGKSTHALLSGCKGNVTAIDTFLGSKMEPKHNPEELFKEFSGNVEKFWDKLKIVRDDFNNFIFEKKYDMIFIDAGHTYKEVKSDILKSLPYATKVICWHNYGEVTWQGVKQAVDEIFWQPDEVIDTIWVKYLDRKVPKIIWSIWLNEDEKIPELVDKCLKTHKLPGYEHRFITLKNCYRNKYIQDCIDTKNWVKAADYLRIYYLNKHGGIYLDADIEVLKPFDDLLGNDLVVCKEDNVYLANGIILAKYGHPLFQEYLDKVDKFDWKDEKIFEYWMQIFTELCYQDKYAQGRKIVPAEYFLPFNHQTGKTNITENTYTYHHALKSWVKPSK